MNLEFLYKSLEQLCKGLVKKEDKVTIELVKLSKIATFSILVDNSDQAKVVGSGGKNIKKIKHIFENCVVFNEEGQRYKIKVFLNSESPERSLPSKFKPATEWNSTPYVNLTENLFKLADESAKVFYQDLKGMTIFEVSIRENFPQSMKRAIEHLIVSIGKCKGITIDINYA